MENGEMNMEDYERLEGKDDLDSSILQRQAELEDNEDDKRRMIYKAYDLKRALGAFKGAEGEYFHIEETDVYDILILCTETASTMSKILKAVRYGDSQVIF